MSLLVMYVRTKGAVSRPLSETLALIAVRQAFLM